MKTIVKKWGNSLGIRIPKVIASDLNLKDGSTVDIEDENGHIIVYPRKFTLHELVQNINKTNIHKEIDFGSSQGNEIW